MKHLLQCFWLYRELFGQQRATRGVIGFSRLSGEPHFSSPSTI
jgi:hypothetical protein